MAYRHKFVTRFYTLTAGTAVAAPGTAYVEFDANYRANIDFSTIHAARARIVVTAQGNEAGNGKGIEIYDSTGPAQVCEVTWDGVGLQNAVAGSFATTVPTVASELTIRVKASSVTENITIYTVDLEVEY